MLSVLRACLVSVSIASVLAPIGAASQSAVPSDRLRTQLKSAISQNNCERQCRRPANLNQKIHCCVFCFGADWICNRGGGCFCEVPFFR